MKKIYVDSRSTSDKELGTKEYPFKNAIDAIKFAKPHSTVIDLEPHVVKLNGEK